jgi:hypothetical protein
LGRCSTRLAMSYAKELDCRLWRMTPGQIRAKR